MATRPTQYRFVPRQGQAFGATVLRYDFAGLWAEYEDSFRTDVVKILARGTPATSRDPKDLLDGSQLGEDAVSCQEWFEHYRAQVQPLAWEAANLLNLAKVADDLRLDDGQWKLAAKDLDAPADEAVNLLRCRIIDLAQAASDHGRNEVRDALNSLRTRFEASRSEWTKPLALSPTQAEELARSAQQLRAYARPGTWYYRLAAKLRLPVRPTWWLSEGQQGSIRRIHQRISEAARTRHANEVRKRKLRVADTVLGTPGINGVLDEALEELHRQELFLASLAAPAAPRTPGRTVGEPYEISLVQGLHTVLNGGTGRTIYHLFDDAVRKAGCSPGDLAGHLQAAGLIIRGRSYPPGAWPKLPVAEVRAALQQEVARYLGADDPGAQLFIDDPRSALEHAAAITPVHPELVPVLKGVVHAWTRQSIPYAEFQAIPRAELKVHCLLYCYPPHRAQWEARLADHIELADPVGSPADAEAYGIKTPYVAILWQCAWGSLGGLKGLPGWLHQSNLLRKEGKFPPLHDPSNYPETRILAERPDDFEDSQLLFQAALKAKAIFPLDGQPPRYALAKQNPRTDPLFAPDLIEPEDVTDEMIHKHLCESRFVRFLEASFPGVSGLAATAQQLARQPDLALAAAGLAQAGILQPRPNRHYRLCCRPPAGDWFPDGFFRRKCGPLVGLTRDDFVAELHRNDDLYNVVFWQVADALDFGLVSVNEAPSFLAGYSAKL